jgi:hypothetical protein
MTDTTPHPLDPADVPPPPPRTLTADELRVVMRGQNIKGALAFLALLLLVGFTAWLAGGGRTASIDNRNSTKVQLAQNARNNCLTERRNAELDAVGREIDAGLKAQKAALVVDDQVELAKQLARFDKASAERDDAAASLKPDVLDQPPPIGCGPAILSLDDLDG